MENQRARQEEQAQKEKEHHSAHHHQFLLVTLFCKFLSSKFDSGGETQWIPTHLPILDFDTQWRWMNFAFGKEFFGIRYAMPQEELEQLREELRRQRELQEAKSVTGQIKVPY